jgi:transcription termination factor Rho
VTTTVAPPADPTLVPASETAQQPAPQDQDAAQTTTPEAAAEGEATGADGAENRPVRAPLPPIPEVTDLYDLQKQSLVELFDLGVNYRLRVGGTRSKHQLVFEIANCWARRGGTIVATGIVEVVREGFGYIRNPRFSFAPQADDIFLFPNMIRRFGIQTGQEVTITARGARENKETHLCVDRITHIEGVPVEEWQAPTPVDKLTPLFPTQRIILDTLKLKSVSTRVVDLVAPLGKGQRALICAPPRGGKTVLLKEIAQAIRINHPEIELMIVLIDERPEEVTDFRETVDSPVYASTFDQGPERHAQVAEVVLERAKRLVEQKKDVIILLDSLTRLARGYNNMEKGKGPIGSGGLSPKALAQARKFFGAARNVEEGGSLTILATALIETDSRMDEVIFEEFKGTGNMEIHIDRELAERRIYPAIHVQRTGTRNDDRLYHPDEFRRVQSLRRQLVQLPAGEAMETLVKNLKNTQNNAEILLSGLRT